MFFLPWSENELWRRVCESKIIFLIFWNAWTALLVKSQWIWKINAGQSSARQNGLPLSLPHRQLECSCKSISEQSWPSLRSADAFPVVASLPPKNSVCEPEQQNDFHDVNLLFWCWPIRPKDRIQLACPLATSRTSVSWILARVTKHALEREFHDYNKVSCDVEWWLLYEATASQAMYVIWAV